MLTKRTTVKATVAALDTLADEAGRRNMTLSDILAEAVEEKARSIRKAKRPRFGLGGS